MKVGVIEFLSGGRAVVFKDADVFEALVFFEVLDALRDQSQELLDGGVGRVPELAIVVRALEQDLVGADGTHAVVKSVAATVGIAFDAVEGVGMNDGARGPLSVVARHAGDDLRRRFGIWTKTARLGRTGLFRDIVSGDDPGASDGVFAKFHGVEG